MSGISSTLSIAKTAIAAQQWGLNVTGQNIANVNNPDYSVQNAQQMSTAPAEYAGLLFGTGVDTQQIQQSVDQLLENRLTDEMSTQASFEEQESYMRVLEGFFDESSQTGISSVLTEFWNSWHDLSDNPLGSAERVSIYESGATLANRFETAAIDMDDLLQDVNSDLNAVVMQINELTQNIADLNRDIVASEVQGSANDLRDQRNRFIDELGQLVNIDTFEQGNGAVIVNIAGAYAVVSGTDTNQVEFQGKEVTWKSSSGGDTVISDKITGGQIGGLLEMRDVVIPKYRAEIDELAREMIWAVNYQHSQGAGLEYFTEGVTGDFAVDDSGWLTSFEFGDKIDFSKDFTMWVEDTTIAETRYDKVSIDMGLSEASVTNWQGTAAGGIQSIYQLTVIDGADLGDKLVAETDGDGLAVLMGNTATSGAAAVLDAAIAEQILHIYGGPEGTSKIEIKDVAGDAKRSASSIAEALNEVEGMEAFASETRVSISTGSTAGVQDGDEFQYSIFVDGLVHQAGFIRDSEAGSLDEQLEESILSAVEDINFINEDSDLQADGLSITSQSGRTLGIQDFEVEDNAGVSLSNFNGFSTEDLVEFQINGTAVSVDLTGVDTTDPIVMAQYFYEAIDVVSQGQDFSVENDLSSNSVIIRTTNGTDLTFNNVSAIAGTPQIQVDNLSGTNTPTPDGLLSFDGADTLTAAAVTISTDTLLFNANGQGLTLSEASNAGGVKSGVITGTITVTMNPGMSIRSDIFGAGSGGLFNDLEATAGSSILTFGGDGGFSNFSAAGGETISFEIDGAVIDFVTTAAGGTTDINFAQYLETQINIGLAAASIDENYTVVRTAASVSIIKDKDLEDPIEINNFTDSLDSNARLSVRTGTGTGANQPVNDLLEADSVRSYRNSTVSTLYSDQGVIKWERLDKDGIKTGSYGYFTVEDEGRVQITEQGLDTVSFDISKGSLVAGNVLTVNTDTLGRPDPLDFRITGQANSINDIYQFRVVSGGKVGHLPDEGEEPIVIEWSNSVETGTFVIKGEDPPYTPMTPVEVEVDGMNLKFHDGTLFGGDVFTITTDDAGTPISTTSTGNPTGEILSSWHWTLDSFADEFNRQSGAMDAFATADNQLMLEASDDYYAVENLSFSGENGFSEVNASVTVNNWDAIDFAASDFHIERSDGAQGTWGILNDPTGGSLQLIPEGGDDDGFGIDFSGDGVADIEISFGQKVDGAGFIEFDFVKHDPDDIGYAFSDAASDDSGLVAAAGINTFFKGYDSMTMEVNDKLSDTKYLAGAKIDSETGTISKGDNANALSMADVQFQETTFKLWTFSREGDSWSSTTASTLDNYYNQLVSSMGVTSRTIKSSKEFADIMVNSLTEQRNSVSAVSLDEEMIKLIRYQHAFSAASKLLTVSDEMLATLISVK